MDRDELERLINDFKATKVNDNKDERIEELEWLCRVFISELRMHIKD